MTKESDRKEINRILRRMVASPFRALLGRGDGVVNVAGKTGWVWARRLDRPEVVFQAYNRGVAASEGLTVLVQGSRIEGLTGYEVIGAAGGGYVDLPSHAAAEPFDAHLNNPCARVYHSAAQSIPNASWTPLNFNTERFDTDTIHDTVANNTRLTCKTAGIYQITGSVRFASNTAGLRALEVLLNGVTDISLINQPDNTHRSGDYIMVTTLYQLAVNSYVELVVYQDSGAALDIVVSGSFSPEFMMVRVG